MSDCKSNPSPTALALYATGDEHVEQEPSTPFHAMPTSNDLIVVKSCSTVTVKSPRSPKFNVFKGHSDFDQNTNVDTKPDNTWNFDKKKRVLTKVMYLSVFASIGALLRIMLAQLFGEECKNPGTVGWLKAGQPLCVTADGDASVEGGIIFADLPANLLGSFIMGLMQPTNVLELPKTMAVAWLGDDNPFQSWSVIHLAIRTGFCGSLTTYSSWNSEMVLMMLGAGQDTGSLVFRGLLGYLIGVETALASFVLGKNIASYLYSVVNPVLRVEAEEIRIKKECGVFINTELPDFERRYLTDFNMGEFAIHVDPLAIKELSRWKESTELYRRVGNDRLALLTDIEYRAIVMSESLDDEMVVLSRELGWDIEALENWTVVRRELQLGDIGMTDSDFRFVPACIIFILVHALLITGIIVLDHEDEYAVTYRTMLYAALLAPWGAVLRWRLSKLNGMISGPFNWLPVGTFIANIVASSISACMIGVEFKYYGKVGFWKLGSARAAKIGFAGSLSTVSTFISEVAGFMKSPNPVRAYLYISLSLGSSCACATIFYSLLTLGVEQDMYY